MLVDDAELTLLVIALENLPSFASLLQDYDDLLLHHSAQWPAAALLMT